MTARRRVALTRHPDWHIPSGQRLHLVRPGRDKEPVTYCGKAVGWIFDRGSNPDPPNCTLCLRFERAAIGREAVAS